MSEYTKNRAFDCIRRLSHTGLDVASFLDKASAVLALAVPNGTDNLKSPYWYTLDPESQLITSDYGGESCDLDTNAVMRWEYLEDDFNKYDEVLRHPRGVQTLHAVTGGEPERSRIYREYMAAGGLAQEMLVSLRARTGASWGTVLRGNPSSIPTRSSSRQQWRRTSPTEYAVDYSWGRRLIQISPMRPGWWFSTPTGRSTHSAPEQIDG